MSMKYQWVVNFWTVFFDEGIIFKCGYLLWVVALVIGITSLIFFTSQTEDYHKSWLLQGHQNMIMIRKWASKDVPIKTGFWGQGEVFHENDAENE